MYRFRWFIVAAIGLPLLNACQLNPSEHSGDRLTYVGEESTYTLAPQCTENVERHTSLEGRPYLLFDVVETRGCFDQFDSWFRGQVGQKVSLRFGEETVTQPSTVYTPIGPKKIRITPDNSALTQRVFTYLTQ